MDNTRIKSLISLAVAIFIIVLLYKVIKFTVIILLPLIFIVIGVFVVYRFLMKNRNT